LDTNVIVSALLRPHGRPSALLTLVMSGRATPCYDGRILAEYADVLARPAFGFDAQVNGAIIHRIRTAGLAVIAPPLALALPDEDDRPFVEVAAAAGAVLVTGNLKHYPGVEQALSVADYLDAMTRSDEEARR
jgi:predicted nucleic acid-binding protein